MRRFAALGLLAIAASMRGQDQPAARPHILGIDHVSFYTTQPEGVTKLYGGLLGFASMKPVEPGGALRFIVGSQWVGFSPAPDPKATDRMDHVAFRTENVDALRQYLIAKRMMTEEIQERSDHSRCFMITDPEGHRIEFVQRPSAELLPGSGSAVSRHMIHVGFLVRSREVEDRFYHNILGFRPYWRGADKPGKPDDWVATQVPDGTDWLEYMLNQPEHPDLQTMGVMNHIS